MSIFPIAGRRRSKASRCRRSAGGGRSGCISTSARTAAAIPYYWIAYTRQNAFKFEHGTDLAALEDNCIALTPLRIDITDEPTMTGLAKLFAKGL